MFRDQFGVNRREVVTTFLKKSIFEGEPTAARDLLRALPIATFRELWQSLVVPVASLFNFDFVLANFQNLIESLFALIIPAAQPAFVPVMPAARITRPFGSGGRSVGGGFRNYFSADIRNTIISAGRAGMMVQLSYDGYNRLVEPYKLEYYVRKKDGRGLEYFWGWDTTGGKSGKIGIKQFICDKISSVSVTNHPFHPRFAVEF